jgi:hypothetical protein
MFGWMDEWMDGLIYIGIKNQFNGLLAAKLINLMLINKTLLLF